MIHNRTISGQTVTLDCDPTFAPLADDVLDTLARIARETGPPFNGMRIRFGWSVITLREHAEGGLLVCEPDFESDPLRQVRPELNTTLRVLAEQTLLLRRVGEQPLDVGFDQFVVAARGALAAPSLQLKRSSSLEPEDSGWYLADATDTGPPQDPDLLEAIRIFMLLRVRPSVMRALALPTGYSVLLQRENIAGVWDSTGRNRWPQE